MILKRFMRILSTRTFLHARSSIYDLIISFSDSRSLIHAEQWTQKQLNKEYPSTTASYQVEEKNDYVLQLRSIHPILSRSLLASRGFAMFIESTFRRSVQSVLFLLHYVQYVKESLSKNLHCFLRLHTSHALPHASISFQLHGIMGGRSSNRTNEYRTSERLSLGCTRPRLERLSTRGDVGLSRFSKQLYQRVVVQQGLKGLSLHFNGLGTSHARESSIYVNNLERRLAKSNDTENLKDE